MKYEVLTDIGKKRSVNEDSAAVFTIPSGPTLAVIADGMGGHRGGDVASSTAVRVIGEKFMELTDERPRSEEEWIQWLQQTVTYINRLLYDIASEDDQYRGMGTTLDAVIIEGNSCIISHIGDSRVYVIDQQAIKQITKDHSFVNVLLESGEITKAEAATHPQRNWIMKALGSEKTIRSDIYTVTLQEGSYLLICTDGLSNKVQETFIRQTVLTDVQLSEKVEKLVFQANKLGGEDNISVILFGPAEVNHS